MPRKNSQKKKMKCTKKYFNNYCNEPETTLWSPFIAQYHFSVKFCILNQNAFVVLYKTRQKNSTLTNKIQHGYAKISLT